MVAPHGFAPGRERCEPAPAVPHSLPRVASHNGGRADQGAPHHDPHHGHSDALRALIRLPPLSAGRTALIISILPPKRVTWGLDDCRFETLQGLLGMLFYPTRIHSHSPGAVDLTAPRCPTATRLNPARTGCGGTIEGRSSG